MSFLMFKPQRIPDKDATIPNYIILVILLALFNTLFFALSQLLNINILVGFFRFILSFFTKIFLVILQVIFSILVTKVYANFLNNGTMKFSYCYISILSSVHLPITLFLMRIGDPKAFFSFPSCLMLLQSILSDHLSRSSVDRCNRETRTMFILSSLTLHIAFYLLLLRNLYYT